VALTHLADTSVLTRLAVPEVGAAIRPLLQTAALARSAMTDLEIGVSARNGDEWYALEDALEVCGALEIDAADFRRALDVQRLLAAAGQRGRKVPDLLIAAVAERHRLTVLHYDGDFDLIAAITGQSAEWVVPAGSAD
jgi:predicted nucleic acid-binding protein